MEKINIKEINESSVWEAFILVHGEANFLHSWYWGEFHKALGKKIYRRGVYSGDTLVGVALLIVEEAKRGKHIIVPLGPIMDWDNTELVRAIFSDIQKCAKIEKVVYVRLRPPLLDSPEVKSLFKKHGFISAPTHLHAELTSEISLEQPLDTILQNMRKQTRSEIRKAEKLQIEVTETIDPESIKQFYEFELETARRQDFVPFSYNFLYQQFKIFAGAGYAKLYTAKYEGNILAQAIIIFYGQEAAYHYGVSTEAGRKYPGAYAIQWKIIQDAKVKGMKTYNLWGVAPLHKTKHRFYSISIFKRGFGGVDRNYFHAHDLIINYPRYIVSYVIEYVRQIRRGLA